MFFKIGRFEREVSNTANKTGCTQTISRGRWESGKLHCQTAVISTSHDIDIPPWIYARDFRYFYCRRETTTNGSISQALRDSRSIICGTRQTVGRTETNDRPRTRSTINRVNVASHD